MDFEYVWKKLYEAVEFMVYSSLDIRDRLEVAYPFFHTLLVHKIPDAGLAQRFE